jgi:triphosphoribosyl-dephospho-CoA synthase
MLPPGLCAQLACIWEATARKPGNVHRYCDFDDAGYVDFLVSAAAVAPVLETAPQRRVGETIWQAIQATRQVTASNTNLGIVMVLAPLATVPPSEPLRTGLLRVLENLSVEDAQAAYRAIRQAAPGGLGEAPEQDVRTEPTQTLRAVMVLAAELDLIARQYANGFHEVFAVGVPALQAGLEKTRTLEDAIVSCQLTLMAVYPDSLIARKRGLAEAAEAGRRARQVLDAGWPHTADGQAALVDLDSWLRAEGHQRNPGTTADLVAACLFVALREGTIHLPPQYPWLAVSDHD